MKNFTLRTKRHTLSAVFLLFFLAQASHIALACPKLVVEEIRAVTCPGAHDGQLKIQVTEGTPPYYISVNNQPAIISNSGRLYLINLTARDYQFSVEDKAGCVFQTTVRLPGPPEFRLDLGPDVTLTEGQQVLLIPSLNFPVNAVRWIPTDYLDEPGSISPNAQPSETTTYQLSVTSLSGCVLSDTITVFVTPLFRVFIPNAFSPNGDGNNDHFMVHGETGSAVVRRLVIFDRWGSLMYEAKELPLNAGNQGWDGTFRGRPASEGGYIYFAEVVRADGELKYYQGEIVLIR